MILIVLTRNHLWTKWLPRTIQFTFIQRRSTTGANWFVDFDSFSSEKFHCINIHKIVSQLMSTRKAYTLMNKKKMSVPISHSPLQNKYWISRFNHTCKPKMLGCQYIYEPIVCHHLLGQKKQSDSSLCKHHTGTIAWNGLQNLKRKITKRKAEV